MIHRSLSIWLLLLVTAGCLHGPYEVSLRNGTNGKIENCRVAWLHNKEMRQVITFGVFDSQVDKCVWPVPGPLGKLSVVQWVDANGVVKSATNRLDVGLWDNGVIFRIHSNDTVSVQAGRNLPEPK